MRTAVLLEYINKMFFLSFSTSVKLTKMILIGNYICSRSIIQKLFNHEENTKKDHKRVVSLYVIEISLDLHKL